MPPDSGRWPYDDIAAIYDDDMGKSAPEGDVAFYVRETAGVDHVLELACGTGRITLPLLHAGRRVTATDRSEPMLEALERKARALPADPIAQGRLRVLRADMSELSLGERFGAVVCAYSAFTYLVDGEERRRALSAIRAHLREGGAFLLDAFVPDLGLLAVPDDHVFFDYRRTLEDGRVLEREKVVRKNVAPGINAVVRRYRIFDDHGELLREFSTESRIHPWEPDALRRELEAHGFHVDVLGDFVEGAIPNRMAAFRCRVGA